MKTQFIKVPNAQVLTVILETLPHLQFSGASDPEFLVFSDGALKGSDCAEGDELTIAQALNTWSWIPLSQPPEFIEGEDQSRGVIVINKWGEVSNASCYEYEGEIQWDLSGLGERNDFDDFDFIAWRDLPILS